MGRAVGIKVSDRQRAILEKWIRNKAESPYLRSGVPPKFTAEQLTQIIAVACEEPEESGRPVTHWTPRELTEEVIQRGIVESISPRHIDRILKGGISAHTRASTG